MSNAPRTHVVAVSDACRPTAVRYLADLLAADAAGLWRGCDLLRPRPVYARGHLSTAVARAMFNCSRAVVGFTFTAEITRHPAGAPIAGGLDQYVCETGGESYPVLDADTADALLADARALLAAEAGVWRAA